MVDLDALAADGFGHWLAGFSDGESCFHTRARRSKRPTCRFRIRLRCDDAPILCEIHARLGVGILESFNAQPADGFERKPQAGYVVQDKTGCLELVRVFDRFPLRSKKARDYAIWREIALEWVKIPRGPGANDWTIIQSLADDLRNVRAYEHPVLP